eukprot:TRINITY_DN43073_c0_g1_i1.p1 TRINITY_DN43073_c0_g1~~TRINITY_DN43073_c0_g1_i1.p1  ORF type:complete len:186 (+),score=46.44 TRINITY_DN43073_c0_g1_i1:76-558(+)
MADLKTKESLERHHVCAESGELPWANNSMLYSKDPTAGFGDDDNVVIERGQNIVPIITEEEAFREIVKKRIQEEADKAKEDRRKKNRLNDADGIEEGAKRANAIVNDVAIGRTRGRGGRGRGRGRGTAAVIVDENSPVTARGRGRGVRGKRGVGTRARGR